MVLATTENIPPCSEIVIVASVHDMPNKLQGIVECSNALRKLGLFSALVLANIDDGQVPIRVMNAMDKEVSLKVGTKVGVFTVLNTNHPPIISLDTKSPQFCSESKTTGSKETTASFPSVSSM